MIKKLNSAIIQVQDIGKTVLVYNGIEYKEFRVLEGMEYNSFGMFILTKQMGSRIHLKKKNKSKKK